MSTSYGQKLIHEINKLITDTLNEQINELINKLKTEKYNINEKDDIGQTPLFICCKKGFVKLSNILLQNNADINLQTNDGWSALMISCQQNKTEIVKLLLDRKDLNVNLQNNNGWSALMIACSDIKLEIITLLLDRKDLNINLQNNNGLSALMISLSRRPPNTAFFHFMRENREKIKNENPSLNFGELRKELSNIWQSLSNEEKNKYELKATEDLKLQQNTISIITLLLQQKDINVYLQDNKGNTMILQLLSSFIIPENNKIVFLKYLLEKGVNPFLKNNKGETAIQIAAKNYDDLELDDKQQNELIEQITLLLNYSYDEHMKILEILINSDTDNKKNIIKLFDDIYIRKCIKCDKNQVNTLFDCGHSVLCDQCFMKFKNPKKCPMCEKVISKIYNNIEARDYQNRNLENEKRKCYKYKQILEDNEIIDGPSMALWKHGKDRNTRKYKNVLEAYKNVFERKLCDNIDGNKKKIKEKI